jgi:hypothetical protein
MADTEMTTTAKAATTGLVAVRRRRQEVIDRLTEDFARDLIDVEEFEERVDGAHRAVSVEDLDKLVADLAPLEKAAPPITDSQAMELHPHRELAPADASRPERRWAVAVLGGVERRGTWRVPHRMKIVCVMGGAEIDFREVALPPGVTEVTVVCVMGGAEIIVPPDLPLECDGVAIMGGFEHVDRAPKQHDPDAPLLRIRGVAFMGGFSIATRLPGETARMARKRQRRERLALEDRERRQLASGGRKP